MNPNYMLDKISEALGYLVRLNTLINKKWYDEQDEFIKCLESVKYDILTIETLIKQEKTKGEMIKKLRNVCEIYNECENCPVYKYEKLKCPVSDYQKLISLKFEEITEMYNTLEEWIKNFILD